MMLNKKLLDLARAIKNAGRSLPTGIPQQSITHVAHSLADEMCTGQERLHFLLACGVPFTL
jgi:hypothetical protein